MDVFAKIRGGIFGAAVGDAIGLTFEGCMPDVSRVPAVRGGGQFDLPLGGVTDDTLMMLALLETFGECGAFDREVFLQKVICSVRQEPVSFGRTTRALVSFLEMGFFPDCAARCVDMLFGSCTNGSVMRTLPVGLALQNPADEARRVSAFSHVSSAACDACEVVSCVAAGLVGGRSKEEVFEGVPDRYLRGELVPSVDALEATRCALVCFRDGADFSDVISRVLRLGGDSDTIAAIAGGLAGIFYGFDAIPTEWVDALLIRDRIEEAIVRFYAAVCE